MSGMPDVDVPESGAAAISSAGRSLALHLRELLRRKGATGENPPAMARDARDPRTGKTMAPPTAYELTNPDAKAKYVGPEFIRGMASYFETEHAELYIPMCVDMGLDPPKITAFAYAIPRWADELEEEDRMLVLDMLWRLGKLRGVAR